MTLKKFFIYVVIIIALYKVVGIIEENDKAKNPPKKSEPIVYFKDEKAIRALLDKEQKIKEVTLFDGYIYVGMYSDGTNRSGYAESLCLSLKPYIEHDVTVKIVDYKDILQKKGFTEMGISRCKPSKQEVKL